MVYFVHQNCIKNVENHIKGDEKLERFCCLVVVNGPATE
jgi:hypothetical protein